MYADEIKAFQSQVPLKKNNKDQEEICNNEEEQFDDISEIDYLFQKVGQYHSSKGYRDMIEFCKRFKELAPFNALMVEIQRPSCKYALSAKDWLKRYERRIKEDARPVVILSYMPVSYLFDLSDTEATTNHYTKDDEIIDELLEKYKIKTPVQDFNFKTLKENLASLGIAYEETMVAGTGYDGHIKRINTTKEISMPSQKGDFKFNARFFINLNKDLSVTAKFTTLLHELGHFFCGHLDLGRSRRYGLSKNTREFEAESVAWLVSERLNIDNHAEKYLSEYLNDNATIPDDISMEVVFKACNEIWRLLFSRVTLKASYLYKNDHVFKSQVDEAMKQKDNKK